MSSKPDIIDISSDSSSDESASSRWANHFPPCAPTSLTKKQRKKVEKPIASDELLTPPPASSLELPSYAPSFYSDDKEPLALAMSLPKELQKDFEKAVTSMRKIPVPESTLPHPKPAKQVLGLPCPKMWDAMPDQARCFHKTMPGYKGKGKHAME